MRRKEGREQIIRSVLGIGAIGLCAAAAIAGITRFRDSDAALDRRLTSAAVDAEQEIVQTLRFAETAALLNARNPTLSTYANVVHEGASPDETERLRGEATRSLEYLERFFPGQISELCLIDVDGHELVRVVAGRAIPKEELLQAKRPDAFFQKTFGLQVGSAHQSKPYLSQTSGKWVVAISTPLPSATFNPSIVNFEFRLDAFSDKLSAATTGTAVRVIDGRTGETVFDNTGTFPERVIASGGISGSAHQTGRGDSPPPSGNETFRYSWLTGRPSDPLVTHDRTRVAVVRVGLSSGSANDWVVVASEPLGSHELNALSGLPTLLGGAGVTLLLFRRLLLKSANHSAASQVDQLTGLANRRALERAMAKTAKGDRTVGVALIDLDGFKPVNDTYGHAVGDKLLVAVAARLSNIVGRGNFVARLGGDEFALLLHNHQSDGEIMSLTETLSRELQRPYEVDGTLIEVGASIGLAITTPENLGPLTLQYADHTMFTAKQLQSRVEVHRDGMESAGERKLALVRELPSALRSGELLMHFQPKVDLKTGALIGAEALLRWDHPTRGSIPPMDFIPLAEQTTLFRSVTEEVIRLSVEQARLWSDLGRPLPIAINLSTRSLLDEDLCSMIEEVLLSYNCPAHLLHLEITESSIMQNPDQARIALNRLRWLGIQLSIDDFGTGYSSLAYLTELQVHELKIDRSFVSKLTADEATRNVVTTIIELGHVLGLRVVAEGVEDAPTRDILFAKGCDVGQGFLWSKALSANEFDEWSVKAVEEMVLKA